MERLRCCPTAFAPVPSTRRGSNHWNEIEVIARPSHWHIGDAAELVRSAGSKALANWENAAGEVSDSSHSGGGMLRNLARPKEL